MGIGLFKQAIIQSASALCDWSIEMNPKEYAMSIAHGLQCPTESNELVECLKNKSPKELIEQQTQQLVMSTLMFNKNGNNHF